MNPSSHTEHAFADAVRRNQATRYITLKSHYDFIVCGAGSSGSVVAARLAENPGVHVLLLEAGGSDDVASVIEPGQWPLNLGTERDWGFMAEPNPHLDGRSIPMNMGKVLGGGSSINVMVWARGHSSDWNYFADQAGDAAWPKLLMQFGIGPEKELRRHGIAVRQHLPGVGQNHQDHVSFGCIWEYAEPQQVGNGGSEATLYWKSDPALDAPDMLHCQVEFPVPSLEHAGHGVPRHGWTMFAGLAHPKSRGELLLSGPEAGDAMIIRANTLSDPDDMRAAHASVEMCRALGNAGAFGRLVKGESMPGKLGREAMEHYLRNAAVTYWHQSCTAKMGRDAMSVVDGKLQVYGIDGLRIADASIMPRITTGNTMAPCVVIGERAADLIKARHRI